MGRLRPDSMYLERSRVSDGESLSPRTFPDLTIAVDDFFAPLSADW